MISIGNDIVDLNAIDKQRTQQKAFYSKILSETEQQLFSRTALPPHVLVWLAWSAKESVYKFAKRLDPELVFSPARIECVFESEFSEFSKFQNLVLDVKRAPQNLNELFNSENSGSDKILEYQIIYQSQTYYLQSLICPEFIATIASDQPDLSAIHWGIKHIQQTDHESQSAAVRDYMLKKLYEIFPAETAFYIDKSPVGYPIILNSQSETAIKTSFAHHGHYVAYAFGT